MIRRFLDSSLFQVTLVATGVALLASIALPGMSSLTYKSATHVMLGKQVFDTTTQPHRTSVFVDDDIAIQGCPTREPSRWGFVPSNSLTVRPWITDDYPQLLATRTRSFGYPFRSLYYSTWFIALDAKPAERMIAIDEGIEFGRKATAKWYDDRSVLPLGIRWPQMLGNLTMWGGSVILIWIIARTMQRLQRARAGLCLHCGYQNNNTLCPECGHSPAPTAPPAPLAHQSAR